MIVSILMFVMMGCVTEVVDTPCENLCDELYRQCAFTAFPSYESCLEGCVYNEEELGSDTKAFLECVEGAECDEFTVMECEHQHGAFEE